MILTPLRSPPYLDCTKVGGRSRRRILSVELSGEFARGSMTRMHPARATPGHRDDRVRVLHRAWRRFRSWDCRSWSSWANPQPHPIGLLLRPWPWSVACSWALGAAAALAWATGAAPPSSAARARGPLGTPRLARAAIMVEGRMHEAKIAASTSSIVALGLGLEEERGQPRDVRRGHRAARHLLEAAAGHGRDDVDARDRPGRERSDPSSVTNSWLDEKSATLSSASQAPTERASA